MLREIVAEALSTLTDVSVEHLPVHDPEPPARFDVIIVSIPDAAEEGDGWRWLARYPASRIVALQGDGSHGVVFEMRPHRFPLGELSAHTLRAAVSGASETIPPGGS